MLEIGRSLTPPPDGEASRRRARLAAASYSEAGEGGRASELLEELITVLEPGTERAISLQLHAQVKARSQGFAEALALAARALDDAGDRADLVTGIELDLGLYSFATGDLQAAARHIHAGLSHLPPGAADPVRAEALACVSMIDFWSGHGRSEARMAEALALEDVNRIRPLEMRPRYIQALLLLWCGDLGGAVAMLRALRKELVERGDEAALPFLSLFLVIALLWRGELIAAEECAQASWETAMLNEEPVSRALALCAQALVSAFRGRPAETRSRADEALGLLQAVNFHIYATWPLWALGVLELSLADAAAAARALTPLCDEITAMGESTRSSASPFPTGSRRSPRPAIPIAPSAGAGGWSAAGPRRTVPGRSRWRRGGAPYWPRHAVTWRRRARTSIRRCAIITGSPCRWSWPAPCSSPVAWSAVVGRSAAPPRLSSAL
jgi:tetratricopeptide (TPR) repeat protein